MDITGFNLSSGGFSINYKHHPHITLLYSDNCPFCRKIKPEWNKLEENYKSKYIFDLIDCDYEQERAMKYDYRALPTIFIDDIKNPPIKKEGYMDYTELEALLKKDTTPVENDYKITVLLSKTCPYCIKFIPVLEDFKKTYSIPIEEVYCNNEPDKCSKIRGVPTTKIYNGDNELDSKGGFMNLDNLISYINLHIEDLDKYIISSKLLKNNKKDLNIYINPKCPYCVKFEPIWNKFKERYSLYYNFNAIDCTKNNEACSNAKIQGVPAVRIMNGSTIIDQHVGYSNENVFEKFLKKNITILTLSVVVTQFCDFSKKMLKNISSFKNKYKNIIDIKIVDNTYTNEFKLDNKIISYPSTYIHSEDKIIKSMIGVIDENELKEWIFYE